MAWERIKEDLQGFLARDPAARSSLEVVLCYPGFHALLLHRGAHWLAGKGFRLTARIIASFSRFLTGIEIHPSARIGRQLVIDHGMGVVIGETAKIGDRVTIYHDVTLGGTSLKREIRHPQVGDDVIIGAGAQLLGPIHVGNGARVGSNAVVVRDVPAGVTVVGVPARPVPVLREAAEAAEQAFAAYGNPTADEENADPVQRELNRVRQEIAALRAEVTALKEGNDMVNDAESTATQWEARQ
jgi:serine O-acetyltransferase